MFLFFLKPKKTKKKKKVVLQVRCTNNIHFCIHDYSHEDVHTTPERTLSSMFP